MTSTKTSLLEALLLMLVGVGLGLQADRLLTPATAARGPNPAQSIPPPAALDLQEAFANTAQRIRPSVVSVITIKHKGGFREGLGSGIVVDGLGHILTNNHVVVGGDSFRVTFADGTRAQAELVGQDALSDLALLHILSKDLPRLQLTPAVLGDSDKVRVGQWCLAVGSPHDLPQTVTAGIISAKDRRNVGLASYEDYLQTDAAINVGNSGGPLVNLRGQVIGINTAILSPRMGSQGISFAIPVNMVHMVLPQLMATGTVVRGWLGVYMENLRSWRGRNLARQAGYKGKKGVAITKVVDQSPAGKAGLKAGDLVLRMDGQTLSDRDRLRFSIARHRPGTQTLLLLWRDGKTQEVTVVLGQLP